MPRISVIIPVYNVAEYLGGAIESILNQEYCDTEILLIDDGSTDGSDKICDEYGARHANIQVIHKPNGGVSSARNIGLDNAQGEWIAFLDADDKLSPETFALCEPYLDDYDIIRFSITDIFAEGRTRRRRLREARTKEEALRHVIGHRTIIGIGGTIYRREIIQRHAIRFDTTLRYAEDWKFLTTAIYHSRSVKTLHNAWCYLYNRYNTTSCTNTISSDKLIQSMVVLGELHSMVGRGYEREVRRARCYRLNRLIQDVGREEAMRALETSTAIFKTPSIGDILCAHIPEKMRWRLLKFWISTRRKHK